MIMVSQPRGRHVLPYQDLRPTLLSPDRREPVGGWTAPPAGHRHPRAARPPAADRPTRCPVGLGRPLGPVSPPPFGSRQGTTPDRHHPPPRPCTDLPAALARDGVPEGYRATPGGTPVRVRRRAGGLPDCPAPPVRTRQRPSRRQVEDGLPDRRVRCATTPSPLPGHGLARRGVAPGPAAGQDAVRPPVHQRPDRRGVVRPSA